MRILLASALLLVLPLAGCGDRAGDVAADPGSSTPPATGSTPTQIPAAPGIVHTRGLVTVMDTGTPEVCLGPVSESYPPQCTGPELAGWDWSVQQSYEHQGDVRWGQFALTGTWDGRVLTVTGAIPAALYDPPHVDGPTYPPGQFAHTMDDQPVSAAELQDLPGAVAAFPAGDHLTVDVVYDDGSIQSWVDRTYGEGVVVVTSELVGAR